MIGIPLGLVTANALEWAFHKYVLHGLGKNKKSFWAFHWHEHHAESRRNDMHDENYKRPLSSWNSQSKEAAALVGAGVLFLPMMPVAPFFTMTMIGSGMYYYHVHKKSHQDPEWAKKHLPWHYDHHMAPDQNCNWGVTWPWFDHILGTRKPYLGTDKQKADAERRASRAKAQQAAKESRQAA